MAQQRFRTILVGIEYPENRRQLALQRASQLAGKTGARLVLFHSVFNAYASGPGYYGSRIEAGVRRLQAARRAALLKLAAPLKSSGLKVSVKVAWDYPAFEAIVREVLRSRPDLVVAETHRHAFGARLFLTNNDWQLIRLCPAPLLFVRHARAYGKARVLAAIDPANAAARSRQLDAGILGFAQDLAAVHDGRLDVVHAYMPVHTYAYSPGLYGEAYAAAIDPQLEARFRSSIERTLKRAVAKLALPERQVHLETGSASIAIPDLARRLKADVVVMGAVSRQGLGRLIIGNTAERMLDQLPCDVLVVKPRGFKTTVPRRFAPMQYDLPPV